MSAEQKKAMERKQAAMSASSGETGVPRKVRNGAVKFPRVLAMFEMPPEERYEVSRLFSPAEAEYARRLAKRELMEEQRFSEACEWDVAEDCSGAYDAISGGAVGESDDGSV